MAHGPNDGTDAVGAVELKLDGWAIHAQAAQGARSLFVGTIRIGLQQPNQPLHRRQVRLLFRIIRCTCLYAAAAWGGRVGGRVKKGSYMGQGGEHLHEAGGKLLESRDQYSGIRAQLRS